MNELALFAGVGGGILGGKLLGWKTVYAVEISAYCRRVLLQRQDDGCLEPFPVWDDIRTFNGLPWRGLVDVISGGFPCQDISDAGDKAGIDGERSGLWSEMVRIIREVRSRYVFVENVAALLDRGIGRVLGDLAEMGYDAVYGVLGTSDTEGTHHRKRVWILAYAKGLDDAAAVGKKGAQRSPQAFQFRGAASAALSRAYWSAHQPVMVGLDDALPGGLEQRVRAIGNGQDPIVAASAYIALREELAMAGMINHSPAGPDAAVNKPTNRANGSQKEVNDQA